jgi:hypothetical protein
MEGVIEKRSLFPVRCKLRAQIQRRRQEAEKLVDQVPLLKTSKKKNKTKQNKTKQSKKTKSNANLTDSHVGVSNRSHRFFLREVAMLWRARHRCG